MFEILQILTLVAFCFCLLIHIQNTSIRIIAIFSSIFFLGFQLQSLVLSGTLVDFRFYQHFTWNAISAGSTVYAYKTLYVLLIVGFLGFLLHKTTKMKFVKKVKPIVSALISCFSIVVMSHEKGVLYNLNDIITLSRATVSEDFSGSIKSISANEVEYIQGSELKIDKFVIKGEERAKPKNILVISMESLEKDFLGDKLAHLTPNLRKLKKEMSYFDMKPAEGSEWTVGAIYTVLTGFPCIFKNPSNQIFQGVKESKIIGLGHVLEEAGYDLSFALAGADFGGIRSILTLNKFKVISDAELPQYRDAGGEWGIYDYDLIAEVKKEIKDQRKNNKPFAMFVHAVGSHPPEGVYDKRMEKFIKKQKTDLDFMVAATDYHVSSLINFLREENLYQDTVIYLYPDHLMMGHLLSSRAINRMSKDRSLFLITNADKNDLSYPTAETIYQIDLAKIILEGAGIKHNIKFFTDLIPAENKGNYISEHKLQILAANESSITKKYSLEKGESLYVEDRFYSKNNKFALNLDASGNLTLYANLNLPLWNAPVGDDYAHRLSLDLDGQLNLYNRKDKLIWTANKVNQVGHRLVIDQDDGVLYLEGQGGEKLWKTHDLNYELRTDEVLHAQQQIWSSNKKYSLALQNDGNLVLYRDFKDPIWESDTDGTDASYLKFVSGGDLVLFDGNNKEIWRQNVQINDINKLRIADNGSLILLNEGNQTLLALGENQDSSRARLR